MDRESQNYSNQSGKVEEKKKKKKKRAKGKDVIQTKA